MKAKRKPYQPKISGSMSFPLEYDGDTVAEFLAIAKYEGLFSYLQGVNLVYSKPRWYRTVFNLVVDDGTQTEIEYKTDKPLDHKELADLVWRLGLSDLDEGITEGITYNVRKSYITAILTEQNR
ncbi:hypothetical protein [Moraxella catarrhalis]|uniref:hypothetical protein n=1 Tax=Moraxella catarrhalis TaxID=480 RepID=UPI000EAA7EF3|nr:hypothetical protein [Moraxella catarrhalis]RKL74598.1 hypothetical protein D6D91_07550 [Moraxella catarrhalis]